MKSITNLYPKSPLRKRGAKLRFKIYFPDRKFDMDLAYKTRILKSEKYKEGYFQEIPVRDQFL